MLNKSTNILQHIKFFTYKKKIEQSLSNVVLPYKEKLALISFIHQYIEPVDEFENYKILPEYEISDNYQYPYEFNLKFGSKDEENKIEINFQEFTCIFDFNYKSSHFNLCLCDSI